jgi:hypothetical protein
MIWPPPVLSENLPLLCINIAITFALYMYVYLTYIIYRYTPTYVKQSAKYTLGTGTAHYHKSNQFFLMLLPFCDDVIWTLLTLMW